LINISLRKNDSFFFVLNKYIIMHSIRLYSKAPVILIDTSYFIFYRYFSTLKWYQFKNKDIIYTDIDKDNEFVSSFEKHVLQDMKKMCKKWNTTLANMIFCCDCSRDRIWRNEYHDNYKGLRVQNPTFNPNIFVKFYEYLEKNQIKWGIHMLNVDRLEADDVVYFTKKTLIDKGWNVPIIIITNDNDYLQLLDDNTIIYNMNGKGGDLSKRSSGNPLLDLRIKMIMGDKSDNIVPIHTGIGQKTAMKLASLTNDEFEAYLDKHQCRDIYLKNKKLVDFCEIPMELSQEFHSSYQFEFVDS